MHSIVVLAAILLSCFLSSAAFLLPCSASSSSLSSTTTRLYASPYYSPPPPGSGRRRRASKWIDAELMKQKELEKRRGKKETAASGSGPDLFPSPPGSSSNSNKEKDKKFLGQARQQLQGEVDTLIERLTGIYKQVKDQSNKITTFGVAEFNPKVATLTDQIGVELESLLGRLEDLKAALRDGEGKAGGASAGTTGKGTPDFLVTQSFALKALSKDLEGLLFLIEAREREVDILLRTLGMEEGGEED